MAEETGTQAPTQTPASTGTPDTGAKTASAGVFIHPETGEKMVPLSIARKHEDRAKENFAAAQKLAAIEESQKTESQKAADRIAALEREAADAKSTALRYEVGAEKGVPTKLLRYLTGSTKEELEANAAQLLADFGTGTDPGKAPGAQSARPKEALRPGAAPTASPDQKQLINDRIRQAAGRRT